MGQINRARQGHTKNPFEFTSVIDLVPTCVLHHGNVANVVADILRIYAVGNPRKGIGNNGTEAIVDRKLW